MGRFSFGEWKEMRKGAEERYFCIHDSKSAHTLRIAEDPSDPYEAAALYFVAPNGCWITGREVSQYTSLRGSRTVLPDRQYLEIGPAFAGFVEHVIAVQGGQNPVHVVEPAPMEELTETAVLAMCYTRGALRERLRTFARRGELLRDKEKVVWHRMPLQQMVRQHPEGIADVVVDNCGAALWGKHKEMTALAKRLLKPGGEYWIGM